MKRLWTEETVTFQGKHLAFDGAYCDPKPIQQLPEIWVGGGGEKVTLRIAAKHADKTNWQIGLEAFVHKSEVLAQYCDEIGRDFDSIIRTHGPDCRIFDTEADLDAWLDSPSGGSLRRGSTPHDEYVRDNFVGTVEQVAEKVQAFVDAGLPRVRALVPRLPVHGVLERVRQGSHPAACAADRARRLMRQCYVDRRDVARRHARARFYGAGRVGGRRHGCSSPAR